MMALVRSEIANGHQWRCAKANKEDEEDKAVLGR